MSTNNPPRYKQVFVVLGALVNPGMVEKWQLPWIHWVCQLQWQEIHGQSR